MSWTQWLELWWSARVVILCQSVLVAMEAWARLKQEG